MNALFAKLKGTVKSVTIWFNGIVVAALLGMPAVVDYLPQLQPWIDAALYKKLMIAVLVANLLLRFRTNKGLEQK